MSRFIRVTRSPQNTGKLNGPLLNANGLEVLRAQLWEAGKPGPHIPVISGARGAQNFRTLSNARVGMMEPIPEGRYQLRSGLEWAGRPGDYSARFPDYPTLGPVVVEIIGYPRYIMWHLDAGAPGSAGCVCPMTIPDLKTSVDWWQAGPIDHVECDWGMGTIGKPESVATQYTVVRDKFFARPGKCRAMRDGKDVASLALRLDYHSERYGLALNNKQIPLDEIDSIAVEIIRKVK